jgi:hydrophobic surface binding protein A
MHFKSLFFLCLGGIVSAGPLLQSVNIDKRSLATIETALTSISKTVSALDSSVRALSTRTNDTAIIAMNSRTVLYAINTATTTIEGSESLSLLDAASLQNTALQLSNLVLTTIKDLSARKSLFTRSGAQIQTLNDLVAQRNASLALGAALLSRVPALAAQTAKMQTQMINMAFDMGIMTFNTTQPTRQPSLSHLARQKLHG